MGWCDWMVQKQNLHSHTLYCDGKNTVDEMVHMAINRGFSTLGFSGHGYYGPDAFTMDADRERLYRRDVLVAKEKYKGQISIFLGVEEELNGKKYSKAEYDFVIGSVHHLKCSIDESKQIQREEIERYYENDFLAYAKAYYEKVEEYANRDEVDIIGHLDLIMKFNEEEDLCLFENTQYLVYAYHCIDVLVAANKIFEVNTGAIARGYRTLPYPHITLLKYIHDCGGKICINSDCHNQEYLDCAYDLAYCLAQEAGFTSHMILTNSGWKEVEFSF